MIYLCVFFTGLHLRNGIPTTPKAQNGIDCTSRLYSFSGVGTGTSSTVQNGICVKNDVIIKWVLYLQWVGTFYFQHPYGLLYDFINLRDILYE